MSTLPEVRLPYEGTFQDPEGPTITVPYLGEVGTFTERRPDLMAVKETGLPHLMHHVPLNKRGTYKLLPGENLFDERLHQSGYALCNGMVQPVNSRGETNPSNRTGVEQPCKAKAINYSGYCSRHGGMLHPLDRKRIDWENAPRELKWKYGKLPVEELDDEELSRGQIRKADGTFTMNKVVHADVHDQMVRKLFARSDEMLQENLLKAVGVFAEIAQGTAYESADRLKAAEFIFTRLRGKVPTEVVLSQDKPFEVVLTDMLTGGSRAESRKRRGVDEGIVDAEFMEEIADLDDGIDVDEGQAVEEVEEEYVPSDHVPLRADWIPRKPLLTGPAGKREEQEVPPTSFESRIIYDKQKADAEAEAEAKRLAFVENSKKFKQQMNKRRAQRIAVRNNGFQDLPKPYVAEQVSYDDDPEGTYLFFKEPE